MNILLSTIIIFNLLIFSGCQLFEDSQALQERKQELELKKLQVQQEKEMALLEMQKSLATIEKDKVLELQKLQNDIKSKELDTNSEKELELIKQKIALQQSNNGLNFQLYLFSFLALVLIVITFFIFYFFKRKREDELRAYNDNLKKYFYNRENEARLKIASKILDTLSDGDLSKDNEQKLINAFAQDQHDYDNDAEIIDAITDETSTSEIDTASDEKRKKNDNE